MAVNRFVQTITEEARGGNSGWLIVWRDGKEDFTFSKELKDAAQEAYDQGVEVTTHYVKSRDGRYWNLGRIEFAPSQERQEPHIEELKPPPLKQWKGDPKNRAFALSYAKDLAVADKIKGTQVIFVAELYYQYLEGNITVPEEVLIKLVADQVKAELRKEE